MKVESHLFFTFDLSRFKTSVFIFFRDYKERKSCLAYTAVNLPRVSVVLKSTCQRSKSEWYFLAEFNFLMFALSFDDRRW